MTQPALLRCQIFRNLFPPFSPADTLTLSLTVLDKIEDEMNNISLQDFAEYLCRCRLLDWIGRL